MAKKEKKVPVSKLAEAMNREEVSIPLDGVEGVNIVVQRVIPLQEVMQFVVDVVASCVDEAEGKYMPEVLPFAIKAHVLTSYTNLSLPTDVKKQYDLVYNTKVVDQVVGKIDQVQYLEILDAINSRIKYATRKMSNAMVDRINEMLVHMKAFADNTEKMFSGVNGEDLASLMQNLARSGGLDEGKLVDAVFAAQKSEGKGTEGSLGNNVVELRKPEE